MKYLKIYIIAVVGWCLLLLCYRSVTDAYVPEDAFIYPPLAVPAFCAVAWLFWPTSTAKKRAQTIKNASAGLGLGRPREVAFTGRVPPRPDLELDISIHSFLERLNSLRVFPAREKELSIARAVPVKLSNTVSYIFTGEDFMLSVSARSMRGNISLITLMPAFCSSRDKIDEGIVSISRYRLAKVIVAAMGPHPSDKTALARVRRALGVDSSAFTDGVKRTASYNEVDYCVRWEEKVGAVLTVCRPGADLSSPPFPDGWPPASRQPLDI